MVEENGGTSDTGGGAPGSGIGDGPGRRTRRRPSLRIGGEAFSWDWVPRSATCFGCGSTLVGDAYGGQDRSGWRGPAESGSEILAFCEACALQRAQGSVGTAVVDGEPRRCTVRNWERSDPRTLEVAVDDAPPAARRERDRLITRHVPVEAFQPERGSRPASP